MLLMPRHPEGLGWSVSRCIYFGYLCRALCASEDQLGLVSRWPPQSSQDHHHAVAYNIGPYICAFYVQMNRPFGVVDVAENLKGAVPKTAIQKVLVSLAEKGALIQKTKP